MKKIITLSLIIIALSSCKKKEYKYYCDCNIIDAQTGQYVDVTVEFYNAYELADGCWSQSGTCESRIEEQ